LFGNPTRSDSFIGNVVEAQPIRMLNSMLKG